MLASVIGFVSPFAADRLAALSLADLSFTDLALSELSRTGLSLPALPRVIAGGYEVRPRTVAYATPPPPPPPRQRTGMTICSGGNRAASGVTCLVDGDTGWENGEKWRIANIDTPELSKPQCAAERRQALAARDRLRSLMAVGYSLSGGDADRYGRRLVTVTLSDGRDAGDVLIEEGLSQPWPNRGNPWCR
jgi:endonuclease YncB( thermonuclease family)